MTTQRHNPEGYSNSEVEHADGKKEEVTRETYEFPALDDNEDGIWSDVSMEFGLTLNLGKFESARITVGIRRPCVPGKEAEAYERCKLWATQRVMKEVKEIRQRPK